MVCYYGKHYSTFFFQTKIRKWMYFDDAHVKEVRRTPRGPACCNAGGGGAASSAQSCSDRNSSKGADGRQGGFVMDEEF